MTDERPFEGRLKIGGLEYFVREGRSHGTRSAVYLGPARCSDEVHRHITAVFDVRTGDIDNLHLTKGSGLESEKKWSIHPDNVKLEAASWILKNSRSLEKHSVGSLERDHYCVSGWRILVGIRLFEGLANIVSWLVLRPLAAMGVLMLQVKEDEAKGSLRVAGRLDMLRAVLIFRKFSRFRGILKVVLPVIVRNGMPRLAKLCLTRVGRMSSGDVSLLIPKRDGASPIIVIKAKEYLELDAFKAFEEAAQLYRDMELGEIIPNGLSLSPGPYIPFTFETKGELNEQET